MLVLVLSKFCLPLLGNHYLWKLNLSVYFPTNARLLCVWVVSENGETLQSRTTFECYFGIKHLRRPIAYLFVCLVGKWNRI